MIWKIFARLPGDFENTEEYARDCFQAGVIAVGWDRLGDLNKYKSRNDVRAGLKKAYPNEVYRHPRKLSQWVGTLWGLKTKVKKGDFILCPDRLSDRVYLGRIASNKLSFDESAIGACEFAHRRAVAWAKVPLNGVDIRSIWPNGKFGGLQTLSKVSSGNTQLNRFFPRKSPRTKKIRSKGNLGWFPDQEWGKAAEKRAFNWLKSRGEKPIDVSHLCVGWDLECNEKKYEVKGRKSHNTIIRLTQNEWLEAKKHKKNYTLLIFTAPTKAKLKTANPAQIPDPVNTCSWKPKIIREYFLNE